jgi:hypothetical protein
MVLTDKEIEKILRDDLRHTRKCVEESLTVLLEIDDDRGNVAREFGSRCFPSLNGVCEGTCPFLWTQQNERAHLSAGRSVRTVVVLRVLER